MNLLQAKEADRLSRLFLQAAQIETLPPEAVCLLASVAVEKGIEAVFILNDITSVPRDYSLPIFYERFVLHGGFPRGIEKQISDLYKMKEGKVPIHSDGGLQLAKDILKEIHRTVKGWILEREGKMTSQ
ncbi:MAG: hypothetical protein N2450_02740 [bacterium]|nr:hypothetical protein [bacterium]